MSWAPRVPTSLCTSNTESVNGNKVVSKTNFSGRRKRAKQRCPALSADKEKGNKRMLDFEETDCRTTLEKQQVAEPEQQSQTPA